MRLSSQIKSTYSEKHNKTMNNTCSTDIEDFCRDRGFLFHKNGSGTWGADRYWTYYKVVNNNRLLYSIEYFPVRNHVKIRCENNSYSGTLESLVHFVELLKVMRIDLDNNIQ